MIKITVFLDFGETRIFGGEHLSWQTLEGGDLKVTTKDLVGNTVVRAWFQSSQWRWFEVEREER